MVEFQKLINHSAPAMTPMLISYAATVGDTWVPST